MGVPPSLQQHTNQGETDGESFAPIIEPRNHQLTWRLKLKVSVWAFSHSPPPSSHLCILWVQVKGIKNFHRREAVLPGSDNTLKWKGSSALKASFLCPSRQMGGDLRQLTVPWARKGRRPGSGWLGRWWEQPWKQGHEEAASQESGEHLTCRSRTPRDEQRRGPGRKAVVEVHDSTYSTQCCGWKSMFPACWLGASPPCKLNLQVCTDSIGCNSNVQQKHTEWTDEKIAWKQQKARGLWVQETWVQILMELLGSCISLQVLTSPKAT